MELCSISRGSMDGRGVWGRMDTQICMAESPLCCSPEAITTWFVNWLYAIQNKKFKKKRAMFLVSALELNQEKKEESIQRN